MTNQKRSPLDPDKESGRGLRHEFMAIQRLCKLTKCQEEIKNGQGDMFNCETASVTGSDLKEMEK